MGSLMARWGRRDRDLVVEAVAALAPLTRRMRSGGQVVQGGHHLGAVSGAQLVTVLARVTCFSVDVCFGWLGQTSLWSSGLV